MEERRKWNNINTEIAKRNYRKLNNELRCENNKAKEEWMKQKCEEIEKLEIKGRYDLIYREVKNLDYGKKSRKGMWLIEDENNEEITDKQGILNTWKKRVEQLYETTNRPDILHIENETYISGDEKEFPILMEQVGLSIKEMKNGKATGGRRNPHSIG